MSINMEFRNVVFNAARDGKLRRLKVSSSPYYVMSYVTQQVGTDFLVNMKMFSKSSVELHFCGLWFVSQVVL